MQNNSRRGEFVESAIASSLIKEMFPDNSYIKEDRGGVGYVKPNCNLFSVKNGESFYPDTYSYATKEDLSNSNKEFFVYDDAYVAVRASREDLSNPAKRKLVKVSLFDDIEHKVNIMGNGSHFMSFFNYGDNYVLLNTLQGGWGENNPIKAEILKRNPRAKFSEITNIFSNGRNDCLANSILSWHIMSQCKEKGLSFEEATSLVSNLKTNAEFKNAVKDVQDSTAQILKAKNSNFQEGLRSRYELNIRNATGKVDNILNGLIEEKLQHVAGSQNRGHNVNLMHLGEPALQEQPKAKRPIERIVLNLKERDTEFRQDKVRLLAESIMADGTKEIKKRYRSLRSDSFSDSYRTQLEEARRTDLTNYFQKQGKDLEKEVTKVITRDLKYMTHFSECRGKEGGASEKSFPLYGRILSGYMAFKNTDTLNMENAISSENAVVMSYKMLEAILSKEPNNKKMSHCMDELKRVAQEEYGLDAKELEALADKRKDIKLQNIDTLKKGQGRQ